MTMAATHATLPALFEASAERFAGNVFVWEKLGGAYAGTTYGEIRQLVRRFAAGLLDLGLAKGDRVALISEGRKEWIVAELGVLSAGGINVPLSVKIDEPSELQFRLSHAGCRMAVVSRSQASKVRALREVLPDLKDLVVLDDDAAQPGEMPASEILARGDAWMARHPDGLRERLRSLTGSDPANICYTSGTVADPKGIVLTHRNYTANIEQSTAMYPLPEHFVTLLVLPWDHAFAHTAGIYALASTGASLACVQQGKTPIETLRNIPGNIREIRPTFLLSVPALAKNFRKGIEAGVRAKGPFTEALFRSGLRVVEAYNAEGFNRGKGWRSLLKPLARLFDRVIFCKIRENFGGRLQYSIGGGALLDIKLQKFFYAVGMPMFQGYGLTEAAPVICANTPEHHKLGSSGMIVPNLEVRICDDRGNDLPVGERGEIVVRGENVMAEYWKNPKATAETIREGWLFTGDLGYLDRDGYLYVLGRAKSLLIAHDGEKYSPEGIEEAIVGHSVYIDQIMLHNSQSPYTVALMVPNREAIQAWIGKHHQGAGGAGAARAVCRLLQNEIDAYRSGGRHAGMFPERWLPSAIALLPEPFTEQNHLLNSTMKMVRSRIEKRYGSRIERLYSPEGKRIDNDENLQVIGSWQ
jgi:long-chain acyl-CoA synthetase